LQGLITITKELYGAAMFKIERVSENRLDIEMSGKLDSDGMAKVLDELVEKSEGIDNGKMLYDIIDYQLPTLDAITLEFKRMPEMFGLIRRFRWAAVLSDKTWLKTISELEGKLMPGLEIKAFGRNERAAAELWLDSKI
jgi:hypothetical protein